MNNESDNSETLPDILPASPLPIFAKWMDRAWQHAGVNNPNAMALSSVVMRNNEPRPSTRIVLLKGFDAEHGHVVFYTNYHSRKGRELDSHARASAVLHWDNLGLQVRFEGIIKRSPEQESDDYFNSRPRESRIGAWTSEQSQPLADRRQLLDQRTARQQEFTQHGDSIPRPPHWGGYRLWLEAVELWCNGEYRLHDRALWTRTLEFAQSESTEHNSVDTEHAQPIKIESWQATRLQP